MDATVTEIRETYRQIMEHEREARRLRERLLGLLGLNSGARPPKRDMLTPKMARALFAEIKVKQQ